VSHAALNTDCLQSGIISFSRKYCNNSFHLLSLQRTGNAVEEVFAVTAWLDYQHCLPHLCVMRELMLMWKKSNDENWPWEMSHFNQTQCMMGKKEGSREGEME